MNKIKNALKTRRFWFSLGAVGVAVATGQVTPDTVSAGASLLGSLFG